VCRFVCVKVANNQGNEEEREKRRRLIIIVEEETQENKNETCTSHALIWKPFRAHAASEIIVKAIKNLA